ncbi:hypothetical protein DY000_02017563 [Brassica cretica]|uniref:Uncharacterized protein n=1 Tax=Brassica cretica TaxID=69181 RepID=A0ABQ7D5Z7_BRACR|nr:hypothetical protein DY000_02017563 [Brassica cretica]
MEMKTRPESTVKTEEERHGEWSRWAKRALESCGLWSSHGKEKPFQEMTANEGQAWSLRSKERAVQGNHTRCEIGAVCGSRSVLKKVCDVKGTRSNLRRGAEELHQLVGKLKYLWKELGVLRTRASDPEMILKRMEQDVVLILLVSLNSSYGQLIMQVTKGEEQADVNGLCDLIQAAYDVHEKNKKRIKSRNGTKCKSARLMRVSKIWIRGRKTKMKRRQLEVELKVIKEIQQLMVMGECSYSAYMGETVGDSADMRGMDTKRADECVTRKEWDEFTKHVGFETKLECVGIAFTTKSDSIEIVTYSDFEDQLS